MRWLTVSPFERVTLGPAKPVELHRVGSTDAEFFFSCVLCFIIIVCSGSLDYLMADMTQQERTSDALKQVRDCSSQDSLQAPVPPSPSPDLVLSLCPPVAVPSESPWWERHALACPGWPGPPPSSLHPRPSPRRLTQSEGSQSNMLLKLFKTVVMWKTKRESGEVDTPLRLTLFLGMLLEYEKRISVNVEQPEDLELLAQQKLLRQKPDGGMEWPYLKWNTEKEVLEESPALKPLDHADLMKNLKILQQSITAPGALLRFHSTRKLVESHQSPLTFLVSIGMRDPQSLLCWRALSELCFNSSGRLLRMRIRPARMERQPLVRVLAEQFPPPEQPMGSGRGWKDKRRSPARTSPGRDKPTGHGKKKEEKDQASDLTTDPASLPSQPAPMETAEARAS
eukprot:s1851_g6.t1